jgi:hypothetical protein
MIAATGDFEIGMNTLDEVNRRAAIQNKIKEEELKVKEQTHHENVKILNCIRSSKPDESKWTKADILAALRVVKKRETGRTHKREMI